MKYLKTFALSLFVLSMAGCSNISEKTSFVDLAIMESKLDSLLASAITHRETPGLAVAVVSGDKVLYSNAVGVSDLETNTALKTTDVFNFTSIAKTVTATAIMQQVEAGDMTLDNTAYSYWNEPFQGLELPTIRQMLSHCSGLQFTDKSAGSDGQLQAGDLRLTNVPGYKLQYSNAAFYSLGQLVAHQNQMDFSDYVKEAIFSPLGMKHSSISADQTPDNIIQGYTFSEEGFSQVAMPATNPRKVGNGILYSTIGDMATWAQMHLNRGTYQRIRILGKDSYKALWKPHLETGWDRMKAAAGLGCFIGKVGDYTSVSHIGGGGGYSAAFVLLPGADRGFVIAANSDKFPREALIDSIAKIVLN